VLFMKKFVKFCEFLLILSLLFSTAAPSLAQLHECKGTWTNKPCGELNKTTEKTSFKDPDQSKKDTLVHDLRMLAIKAKREHDIRYDLTVTEENCKKFNLEQCDLAVKSTQKDLQKLITEAQDVKASQERNELIKQANKIRQERNEIEASKPSVVIQQNTILVPRRRPGWRRTFKGASSSDQSSSLPTDVKLPE
jgi:hypothetical protein